MLNVQGHPDRITERHPYWITIIFLSLTEVLLDRECDLSFTLI